MQVAGREPMSPVPGLSRSYGRILLMEEPGQPVQAAGSRFRVLRPLAIGLVAVLACDAPYSTRTDESPPALAALVVAPVRFEILAGDTIRLTVEAIDAAGHPVRSARPVWSVSPVEAAAVDSTGLVTAHAAGEILVTVTAGGRRSTAGGTVRAAPP